MESPTTDDERKTLKLQILSSKAKHIEDIINARMDEVEELTNVYSSTLDQINKLRYDPNHLEHMQTLMNKMRGEGNEPKPYSQCNTSEELLKKALHDVNRQEMYENAPDAKVTAAAKAEGVPIPSLSNNDEVLSRMSAARKRESDEEKNKTGEIVEL